MSIDTDPSGFDSDIAIRAVGPTTWSTLTPLIWTGERDTFTVPIGFETDFATVPRFMHWLISPYGAYTRAAVLHDWLLTELAAWWESDPYLDDDGRPAGLPANSQDTDGVFRRAMKDLGVGFAKRWIMWAGVRWGALFNSRRAYGRNFASDAGKVIGISLLALPVIIWGAAGTVISLTIVRLITWKLPVARRIRRGRLSGPSIMKGK